MLIISSKEEIAVKYLKKNLLYLVIGGMKIKNCFEILSYTINMVEINITKDMTKWMSICSKGNTHNANFYGYY